MDFSTFLLTVFCMIDDGLKEQRLCQRGPQPTLSDSQVLTIEIVGEGLGLDTDVRQAANLCLTKARLWHELLNRLDLDHQLSLVDSFPVPVCRFARAQRLSQLGWSRRLWL